MIHPDETGTKNKIEKIVLPGIIIPIIILLAIFAFKAAIVNQFASSNSIYLDITSRFQTNPDILAELARQEQMNGNLKKAHQLYVRALDSFVLHAPSWLGVAEVLMDMGKRKEALAALQELDTFNLDNGKLLWRKAHLARELHEDAILLATLKQLIQTGQESKNRIFNLAGEYWNDPHFLLNNFTSSLYPDILQFFIRKKQMAPTRTVWNAIKENGVGNTDTSVDYVSFLLENNEFDLAAAEWRDAFQQNDSLLYNGNFANPILNKAFGWHVSQTKGATLQNEPQGGGLIILFAGTGNSTFNLFQVVPMKPGEYVFRGFFETTDLTSEQRPFWQISGYNCQGLYIKDVMLPASEFTTEFALPFTVPDSCEAVKIGLMRKKANDYDVLFAGSLTLTDLEINRLSPASAKQVPTGKKEVKQEVQPLVNQVSEMTERENTEGQSKKNRMKSTNIFIHKLIVRP